MDLTGHNNLIVALLWAVSDLGSYEDPLGEQWLETIQDEYRWTGLTGVVVVDTSCLECTEVLKTFTVLGGLRGTE